MFALLAASSVVAAVLVPGGGLIVPILGLLTPFRRHRTLAIALLAVGVVSSAVVLGVFWFDMHHELHVTTTFGVGTNS